MHAIYQHKPEPSHLDLSPTPFLHKCRCAPYGVWQLCWNQVMPWKWMKSRSTWQRHWFFFKKIVRLHLNDWWMDRRGLFFFYYFLKNKDIINSTYGVENSSFGRRTTGPRLIALVCIHAISKSYGNSISYAWLEVSKVSYKKFLVKFVKLTSPKYNFHLEAVLCETIRWQAPYSAPGHQPSSSKIFQWASHLKRKYQDFLKLKNLLMFPHIIRAHII